MPENQNLKDLAELPWRHKLAIAMIGSTNNGTIILDIGCGEFALLERYLISRNCTVVALDLNVQALHKAKSLIQVGAPTNVNFIQAAATALPLKQHSIDKLVMLEVIEHLGLNREEAALKECSRVSKHGGTLVLSTPNYCLLANLLDPHWLLGHRHYKQQTLKEKIVGSSFRLERTLVRGGMISAFGYIVYLPWHLIWSHLVQRSTEPPFPFQRYLCKLSAQEFLTEQRRLGTTIFLRAVKDH